jgi:hypothetical protein
LCRGCIEKHVDTDALRQWHDVEEAERETLAQMVANMPKTDTGDDE